MDMGMALSTPDDAPKSRLGRAKRVLQKSNNPTKSTGPSFAGFQPVDGNAPAPSAPPLPPPPLPSMASFTSATDDDAFELAPQTAPDPLNPFSGEVASLDLPVVSSPVDHLPLPDLESLTPTPTKDVSLEELRAILTGAPDRFENIQHATWDPMAAATKQAEPSFESQTEKFRIAAANLAAMPPTDTVSDAPVSDAAAFATTNEASVGAFTAARGPVIADITAQPLPDLSGFDRSTIERVTKESITPAKTMKKGRLAAVFAKQDAPNPSLAESLSERSTKVLRIAAGALLALGLLLVAFLQFRGDDTPKPTIPAITVENTTPSVGSPSGNPIDVPIAGQDSTSTIAGAVEDDFFSEGEDFSFSEGEDFTVK